MSRRRRRKRGRPRRRPSGWVLGFGLLIVVAWACAARAWWIDTKVMRDVLTVPLRLEAGARAEGKFTLDYGGLHEVTIAVGPAEGKGEEQELGQDPKAFYERQARLFEQLRARTEIWEDTARVATLPFPDPASLFETSASGAGALLGEFPAQPGKIYRVTLECLSVAPAAAGRPATLRISQNPAEGKLRTYDALLWETGGTILGGAAFLLLAVGIARDLRKASHAWRALRRGREAPPVEPPPPDSQPLNPSRCALS